MDHVPQIQILFCDGKVVYNLTCIDIRASADDGPDDLPTALVAELVRVGRLIRDPELATATVMVGTDDEVNWDSGSSYDFSNTIELVVILSVAWEGITSCGIERVDLEELAIVIWVVEVVRSRRVHHAMSQYRYQTGHDGHRGRDAELGNHG